MVKKIANRCIQIIIKTFKDNKLYNKMNKIIYFIIFKIVSCIDLRGIKNIQYPFCVKCKHFMPEKYYYPDDPPPDDRLGKCGLFGEVDIVTGSIEYDFAKHARNDFKRCGIKGSLFENKEIRNDDHDDDNMEGRERTTTLRKP
jgi:hypothetical protein